jgi:hypothetical protein
LIFLTLLLEVCKDLFEVLEFTVRFVGTLVRLCFGQNFSESRVNRGLAQLVLVEGKALDELLERPLGLIGKERETEGDIPPLLLICRGRVTETLAKLLDEVLRLLIL